MIHKAFNVRKDPLGHGIKALTPGAARHLLMDLETLALPEKKMILAANDWGAQ